MDEQDYYYSPNDFPAYGLYGTVTPWGWIVSDSHYDSEMGETEITLQIGYDGDIHEHVIYMPGVIMDMVAAVMSVSEFANSTGPIRGGGFPKK